MVGKRDGDMPSDAEFDNLCEEALACKSEEQAFEIIQRLRPYFPDACADAQAHSEKHEPE